MYPWYLNERQDYKDCLEVDVSRIRSMKWKPWNIDRMMYALPWKNSLSQESHAIWQWFVRVTKSRVIQGKLYIILFLTRYFMQNINTRLTENSHRSLILSLSPRTIISILASWRHNNWTVASREYDVLVLWCVRNVKEQCTSNTPQ